MASLTLKYLRAGGVVCATTKMRNRNEHPVRVRVHEDNPIDQDWDNHPEILWKFAIHYLASEGLTETSEETRPILVYIFHGQYHFTRTVRESKKLYLKPILHALHFNLTSHRSRFVTGVEKHFKQLFDLLDKHPTWEQFLDDQGDGAPTRAFLIAVEVGIRSYAFATNSKMTMGVGVNKVLSKRLYANIKPWRKIECYVTGVRFRRGRTSYRRWEDFLWSDFVERKHLAETFIQRHLPLSDGEDHFGGELTDPPQWAAVSPALEKKAQKSSTRNTKVKVERSVRPLKFDASTGSLVPYIDMTS
jgi:hypothetical protein